MQKTKSGFTIVELLIVIVVIAILAAISIVAYNGIQQRARNTQTINAVSAFAKAFQLYFTDKGTHLTPSGCIGLDYGYGPNGTASSGFQCRQDSASAGVNINSTVNNALLEYMGGSMPQPATSKSHFYTATSWYRGAYYYATNPARIDFVLEGKLGSCPDIPGATITGRSTDATTDTTLCIARLNT